MVSSNAICDDINQAASLAIIEVRKDKDQMMTNTSQAKSGDITKRLAALTREMNGVPTPPLSTAPAISEATPKQSTPAESQPDQARPLKKPQYRGWRKAENPDDLLSYWASLRRGQKYPDRTRLDTEKIGKSWPNSLLVNCDRNSGRMQLDYEFIQSLRTASTGQAEDSIEQLKIDINPMIIDWIFALCRDVAINGEPDLATEIFPTKSGESNIRLIALPLSKDQREIDFVLCYLQEI